MKAIFAGSFDPFTVGHRSIVERALKFVDSLVIAIGFNERKPGEWTVEERVNAISALFENDSRVTVTSYTGLTMDYARAIGADFILRGVRGMTDFEYERNLADANMEVGGIETVFLISEPRYSFISSSMVRELMHNNYDVSRFIAGDFSIPPMGQR